MPQAILNGTVIAEADEADVLHIEGRVYFPPSSVKSELLAGEPTPYTCPWKGECQYFSVKDPRSRATGCRTAPGATPPVPDGVRPGRHRLLELRGVLEGSQVSERAAA